MFDFGVEPEQLRPYSGSNMQRRGYPLGPLADAWRRYLPPLSLGLKAVNDVTGDTRKVLDKFFAWVLVDDDGKPVTDGSTAVTDVTGLTGFRPRERDQETDVTAFSSRERDQETKAEETTPNQEAAEPSATDAGGAPNIAKILDLPAFKPRR
jgi:hypothetical protein